MTLSYIAVKKTMNYLDLENSCAYFGVNKDNC